MTKTNDMNEQQKFSLRSIDEIQSRIKHLKSRENELVKVYEDAYEKYQFDFEHWGSDVADETESITALNSLFVLRVQIMQLEWVLNLRF